MGTKMTSEDSVSGCRPTRDPVDKVGHCTWTPTHTLCIRHIHYMTGSHRWHVPDMT